MESLSFMESDGGGVSVSDHKEQYNGDFHLSMRENVMTVELAIKRELAYRMRIEKLKAKSKSIGDIREAPIRPPQCPPPSPSLAGMKRKTLSSILPLQQPRGSYSCGALQNHLNLFCKVCQVSFPNQVNLKQHQEGTQHKAKVKESAESRKRKIEKNTHTYWCKLCSIPCCGEASYRQHLIGKKHTIRVQMIESAKKSRQGSETEALKVKWDELEWEKVV
ncbi:hypothetical protein GIB67_039365 [Kingdonia uniflora]|uniref:C2H2-type domain-containing protein n=1 Tax=Kingdonia uniflora TaxID=39325 RepID=A0A7J7LXA5_9MAGN|nr:hypothetical protein GIB67_039365 [Kingdonia uniflora]